MAEELKNTVAPSDKEASQKRELLKELEDLLGGFKDSDGTIPKGLPYLKTEKGKRILQLVIDLNLNWNETEKLLERSKSTIEKAFSTNKIRKPHPDHISAPNIL